MQLTGGTEDDKTRTPPVSFVLAYAAMAPIAAGAAGSLLLRQSGAPLARLTVGWAGAVLCFLSGVRRGLSFRQQGGPTTGQLGSMLWMFVLGAGSLLSPWRVPSILLLLLGFGSERVLDPAAARKHEAPRYFARLRPAQLAVPILSLLVLLAAEYDRSATPSR